MITKEQIEELGFEYEYTIVGNNSKVSYYKDDDQTLTVVEPNNDHMKMIVKGTSEDWIFSEVSNRYISKEEIERNRKEVEIRDKVFNSTEYYPVLDDMVPYGTIQAINPELGMSITISTHKSQKANRELAQRIMRNLSNHYAELYRQ